VDTAADPAIGPLPSADIEDAELGHWSTDELASFLTHPGTGRVLLIRSALREPWELEDTLRGAGYLLGRLPLTREPSHLPHAAATFLPDVVFVAVGEAAEPAMAALEALATDPRTLGVPIVALLGPEAPPAVIEEAYTRSGCDFFHLGRSEVELLARTHLLVRLVRAQADSRNLALREPPSPPAANSAGGGRLDLQDPVSGAHSQTYFLHRLPSEISRARRYARPLALLAVRCADAGRDDRVASELARRLRSHVRSVDMVARVESGLFAVLLPETRVDATVPLVTRMRSDLRELGFSVGIGCAGLDEPDTPSFTSVQLLQAAARRAER
jgi:PleD family two-component response regulator